MAQRHRQEHVAKIAIEYDLIVGCECPHCGHQWKPDNLDNPHKRCPSCDRRWPISREKRQMIKARKNEG